jgi:hypothetical protein
MPTSRWVRRRNQSYFSAVDSSLYNCSVRTLLTPGSVMGSCSLSSCGCSHPRPAVNAAFVPQRRAAFLDVLEKIRTRRTVIAEFSC